MSQVVPESLEDLSVEGADACHVQVKSRQEHKGDFTARQAARFLLELFELHVSRERSGQRGQPVLVVERPVAGEVFREWGQVLGDLPIDHRLRIAVRELAQENGLEPAEIDQMLSALSIFVLPWRTAAVETRDAVAARYDLLPSAAEQGVLVLRDAVAECVDENAVAGWESRAGLDRTAIERITAEAASLVDREALEEALRTGAVELVDFDQPLVTPAFYEGIDVQPGHIAAGLPAPRPEVTGEVVETILRGEAVLVTGPSGAGKSTVMWAAAYVTRHVLWFRVRRLRDDDVSSIVRLAKAMRPTGRSPVGFVVDAVGLGATAGWDDLQRQLASVPGVVLLGSARTEDTLLLRNLAACSTVPVGLDEVVAEQIYKGLTTAGVEVAPHWRDAYENSRGLTLEFTHLLTRGRRLSEVVTEQVRRRVVESRDLELKIIALVAVAHRWGAELPMRAVQDEVGADDSDFRVALARLNEEHLLHSRGNVVTGLHQLRSVALAEAVHAMPPPLLTETVESLLSLLDDHQLQPFVANGLIEQPNLDSSAVARLTAELARRRSCAAFIAALQALRLVDFHRQAQEWVGTFERHGVAPARRVVTLQLAMLESDLPSFMRSEVVDVISDIVPAAGWNASSLRDLLLSALGPHAAAQFITECADAADLQQCLAVMAGTSVNIIDALSDALPGSPLPRLVETFTGDVVGEVLSTARLVSPEFARHLATSLFGGRAVLDRLRSEELWLTEASIVEDDGVPTAFARLLHISDAVQPQVVTKTRNFARTLLRCLPECDRADVRTLWPGGLPMRVGDFDLAAFTPGRSNDHPPAAVAWNRMRSQVAASAMGVMDPTVRVHVARELVRDATLYLSHLANTWCADRRRANDEQSLLAQRTSLLQRAAELTLPLKRTELFASRNGPAEASKADSLHSLIDSIADKLAARLDTPSQTSALAGDVGDNLRRYVREVRDVEQWSLTGQASPDDLDRLDELLGDLHAVLAELAWGELTRQDIRQAARAGNRREVLRRVADTARAMAWGRDVRRRGEFVDAARAAGHSVRVVIREPEHPVAVNWPPTEMSVLAEVDDVTQWNRISDALAGLLSYDPASEGWRPPILIVPTYQGRVIPSLGKELIARTLHPSPRSIWSDGWPALHPTPLTDAAIEAHRALQVLSGLAVLSVSRELDSRHVAFVQPEIERYEQALRAIGALRPADAVTARISQYLASTAQRVEREINDGLEDGTEEAALAVGIAQGAAGIPTEDSTTLDILVMICLQWDLDPAIAARLLE
ncbi:hypothetical protein [Lentzea flaviverrucosa]|uniref:hypothetical protein n=1 Tax=Lentzea flaviverrucosa TaxID=200379 RepID=UPI0011603E97|nr:hypothetical protein [Lentzea flaviverrucosa]